MLPDNGTNMKPLSFADMYGLALIAKKPKGVNRSEIVKHLSPDARQIANAIIGPTRTARESESASENLPNGDRAKNSDVD
jgi:hypothetical protein